MLHRSSTHSRRRDTSPPTNTASNRPTAPAIRRCPSGSFFPHSQPPPSHFPVVISVLTDSRQGQVDMGNIIHKIPLVAKRNPPRQADEFLRPRTVQCMVWHMTSMCSIAGTASRLASPVPLENQHRSPATSCHTTLTMPCLVQMVA